jgi:hypothetical protein
MIIARFINGKLAGQQYAKKETIDKCTDSYPFQKEGDESNQVAWAKRWATHPALGEVRTVEIIDNEKWNPSQYEKHIYAEENALDKRISALEAKAKEVK